MGAIPRPGPVRAVRAPVADSWRRSLDAGLDPAGSRLAPVRAHRADTAGNLTYRYTARNFNPVVATAGRLTIAEAEHIVLAGELDPNHVVTPGVYVQRLVPATAREKPIEQRTVRQRDAVTEGAFR